MREYQQALNPKTGRMEVVFTDLRLVYPDYNDPMAVEYSFEELRARHRGWSAIDWNARRAEQQRKASKKQPKAEAAPAPSEKAAPLAVFREQPNEQVMPVAVFREQQNKPQTVPLKGGNEEDLAGNDENSQPSQAELEQARLARKARREERANRTRKIKVMEVREIRGETQTSKFSVHGSQTATDDCSPSQS